MNSVIFKNINQDDYSNKDAIDNVISYIYRIDKSQLPIYCYGCIKWPPTYNSLIGEYHYIRTAVKLSTLNQQAIDQQIIHFVISFNISEGDIAEKCFYFADDIAKLFSAEYQVCYAYHTDTGHPHFHYVVSTTSYLIGNSPLTNDKMAQYELQIQRLADAYEFKFHTEGAKQHV